MQCEEWADANSELFKEAHDETVHKNSYKRKLYELISASLDVVEKVKKAARNSYRLDKRVYEPLTSGLYPCPFSLYTLLRLQ